MDQHHKTDQELVAAYLEGDPQSLELLIARHLPSVYNFIARFTGDVAEAHDLTQETFLKAWKYLKKFDQKRNFKTWIFTIARNTSLDWLRKRKPMSFSALASFSKEDDETLDIPDESIIPLEDVFDTKQDAERVAKIVKSLPPAQQTVIAMKIKEDFTFQDMSEILGQPLNTVKSRYRRALVVLRNNMKSHHKK